MSIKKSRPNIRTSPGSPRASSPSLTASALSTWFLQIHQLYSIDRRELHSTYCKAASDCQPIHSQFWAVLQLYSNSCWLFRRNRAESRAPRRGVGRGKRLGMGGKCGQRPRDPADRVGMVGKAGLITIYVRRVVCCPVHLRARLSRQVQQQCRGRSRARRRHGMGRR